jgi:hypothetical protein
MTWKDWLWALALTVLAGTDAVLLEEYRRARSRAALFGVLAIFLVVGSRTRRTSRSTIPTISRSFSPL